MHNEELRKRIIKNEAEIQKLKSEQNKLKEELQESCSHASIVKLSAYTPPRRKCVICLKEEVGPNYNILTTVHFEDARHPQNRYDKLKPLNVILVPEE